MHMRNQLLTVISVHFACFSVFLNHPFIPQGEKYYPFIKPQFHVAPPPPLEGDNQGKFFIPGKEGSGSGRMTKECNFFNQITEVIV